MLVFLRQMFVRLRRRAARAFSRGIYPPPDLEYSHAIGRVQYDMLPQPIAKVSLVRALIRLRHAAQTESVRKQNLEQLDAFLKRTGAGEILPTPYAASAPFVPVNVLNPGCLAWLPWKGPYGMEGFPEKTLRPELLCFKNDGLDSFNTLVEEHVIRS
jgi:hypothetical protein